MATEFKNVQKKLTATAETVYTAPANTTAIMFTGVLASLLTDKLAQVTMTLTQGSTTTEIVHNVPLPFGSSLQLPKVVVQSGGILKVNTDAVGNGKVDMTLGILETA